MQKSIYVILALLLFSLAADANPKRIRSVKKFGSRAYMFECASSFESPEHSISVHAEYFKKCNSIKSIGPACRLEMNDGKNTQLEQFITEFQRDIRQGQVEAGTIASCPKMLGAIREVMDTNGCTAKISICYPAKYVQNNKSLKSDRKPASLPTPAHKPKVKKTKRTEINL